MTDKVVKIGKYKVASKADPLPRHTWPSLIKHIQWAIDEIDNPCATQVHRDYMGKDLEVYMTSLNIRVNRLIEERCNVN